MALTVTLKNATDSPLWVSLFASHTGNARKKVRLQPGGSVNVNRIPRETLDLIDSGKLVRDFATGDASDPHPERKLQITAIPMRDMEFIPNYVSLDPKTRRPKAVATDDFSWSRGHNVFVIKIKPRSNLDIDWWNYERGPYVQLRQLFKGDFLISVTVKTDGALDNNDWAGIIIQSAVQETHFARLMMSRKNNPNEPLVSGAQQEVPIFERLFHHGVNLKNPTLHGEFTFLGDGNEEGVYDWNTSSYIAVPSYAEREDASEAVLVIERCGADVTLRSYEPGVNRTRTLTMQNFMPGPARICFAVGKYGSQGSTFCGAVFRDIVGEY